MKLPEGFLLSGLHCGIKKKKFDLGLVYCLEASPGVAFFTNNVNVSYSVTLSRENIKNPIKAVLVNSGNANCYSGKDGLVKTRRLIKDFAAYLDIKSDQVLFASTGIIGKALPVNKIKKAIPNLVKGLVPESDDFAKALLTTDAFVKTAHRSFKSKNGTVTISGFAKGAGMIAPNMATMLGVIITDCDIPKVTLKKLSKRAIDLSFNSISVDGCTSTNDMVTVLSSRKTKLTSKKEIAAFSAALNEVCLKLAKLIVQDGEGASKQVTIKVCGAKNEAEAKKGGLALANSMLFKCALYGANANWGRIIQALGQAGIKVNENISIKAGPLHKKNVTITIDLKQGKHAWSVYTCDLTPGYIKINADYN